MKHLVTITIIIFSLSAPSYGMTRPDSPQTSTDMRVVAKAVQSGKVEAIYASAGKIVIGGVTYAYHPLDTVVMVEGKRVTISDIKVGDSLQFQSMTNGANNVPTLTRINRDKP